MTLTAGYFYEDVYLFSSNLNFCFIAAIEINITAVKRKLKLDQNKFPHKTMMLFFGHLKDA